MGEPASSEKAAKRRTELTWTVGPTLKIGVGGPASSEKAAKRCTELNRTVGPTLNRRMQWVKFRGKDSRPR